MKRHLLILGIGILLLTSILRITFAEKTEKLTATERLQVTLQTMNPKDEQIHLRTLNQRTFKKVNGKMVTFLSTAPLNYMDDDNQLKPIDINLVTDTPVKNNKALKNEGKQKFRHHALNNSIKAWFANESDSGVQLEYKKHSVEFILKHRNKRQALIEKNKIHYKKVFDNCDLVYSILPGQVKDELIFYSIPKISIISYKLKMDQKLTPKNGPKGSINLIDQSGKPVFSLLPAVMFEKDDQNKLKIVETKFHWSQKDLYCDMVLDMSWLKDKKRHYPIVIDPIVSPAPISNGTTGNRTLIHCPESYGKIKCEIDLDGPGWHGWLASHDNARAYFRDNTANQVFLSYNDVDNYHPDPYEVNISENHDYEVYIYGGSAHHLFDGTFDGRAYAIIEYGGENGLFKNKLKGNFFTGANNYTVLKSISIKYPQWIKYYYNIESNNSNISVPVVPYCRINPGPNLTVGTSSQILLNKGEYTIELSPSNKSHYRAEFEFPLGTSNYEKKIVLRTNPGTIESTFRLPSNGDVYLQYHTIRNDNPSSQAFPNIKIASGASVVYDKNLPLDYYNIYDGGEKVYLEKEKPYTLTVSRGRNGGNGWGGVNLDFFYKENDANQGNIPSIQLIDKNGIPFTGAYASLDNRIRFQYNNENLTLKSYTLYINDDEYQINNPSAPSGWVTIPYTIKDYKLNSGTTFHCKIKTFDGFDFIDSTLKVFAVDSSPPVIESFSGEVVNQNGSNSINLVCEARDELSSVQKGEITWKVNGQPGGTHPWSANTDTITNLPYNAKIAVTFSVTDNANNTASLTKEFFTYPESSKLVSPVAIYTTKPGKYHPTLKFTKTGAPEYRIQRFLKRDSQPDLLEYDTGFMDASTLSTATLLSPGLNIISPVNGSRFGRDAFITLTAFTDADCNIYKVDFYANGTFIGKDTSSPFSLLWRNVTPGDYTLKAVATDTDGMTQTSPPIVIKVTNTPPTVRIITPVSGSAYPQPASIYLKAEAVDPDGDISKVDFYYGNNLIGTDSTSPYSIMWNRVGSGNYNLTAKATDSDGATSISDPVSVIVTNVKPTVSITSPTSEQVFTRSASVTINANANDRDGSISRVDFYVDGLYKGSDYGSPYSFTWSSVPTGRYSLKVIAVDNNGEGTWSEPVYITVIEAPDDLWDGWITICDDYWSGHWENIKIWDDVNNSNYQQFLYFDNYPSNIYIINQSVNTFASFTTYYWVPRDVTVINYAFYDDYFQVYNNGVLVGIGDWAQYGVNWNNPITIKLKGNQWNQITMTIDNRCGGHFGLGLASNFKYLIQQALNYSGGGTVYMSSLTNTASSMSSMSVSDSVATIPSFNTNQGTFSLMNSTGSTSGLNDSKLNTASFTASTSQEYYSYIDLLPVNPHQTYVYRIWTKNGEKIASLDSSSVSVMNNEPEIKGVEPNRDTKTYSNGAFSIRVTDAQDYDGDTLRYYFKITGPVTIDSSNQDPYQREFTGNNLPDGTYKWTATLSDTYNTTDNVSGTFIVDNTIPTALFSINNSALYATNRNISLSVTDASSNVDMIRISNDKNKWSEFTGSNQVITWQLSPEDGRKIVYLQAHKLGTEKNAWGPVVERSIILDTTPPEVSTLHINNDGDVGKVTFHWIGGSDATSELSGKINIQIWENGQWANYQTDYQENQIEIPATGYNTSVKIRLQLIDKAGITSDWSEPSEGFTKAAPGNFNKAETISGYSDTMGHYLLLKLNPVEGAVQYKIECVQNPGGGDTAFVTNNLTYQDYGVLPHKAYQYRILTYNSNQEITEGEPEEFTIINNPPAVPVGTGPKGLLKDKEGIVYTFEQPLEMLDPDGDNLNVIYLFSTDGQNFTETSSCILTNLSEGVTYWWKIKIDDGLGGVQESQPLSFSIDTTPPIIIVDNLSEEYAREHQVQINVSDSGSNIKTIKINGITTTILNSKVTLNTQGANHLEVEAIDEAGNIASFIHTYYVDLEPPVCSNIRFALPERNGKYLASNNIVPVLWNAVDPETGIAKFKYSWSETPNINQEMSLLGEQGSYSADIIGTFVDGQTYYLNLQAENYLGIISPVFQSAPLLYDHSGPILSISSLSGGDQFNGIRYYKSLQNLSLTVSANDPDTNISKIEYTLVESPANDNNNIQWFNSLADLVRNYNAIDGKVYYLAVKATNGTNLTNIVFSEPIIVDSSEPIITITTLSEQKDNQVYQAQVGVTDPDTMVVKLEYGIGANKGSTNLSKGLPSADADGWITVNYPSSIIELKQFANIPLGTTYFVTVKATNITGVTIVKSSSGTQVVSSNAPIVRDEGNYTSDNTMLYFEWNFPNNVRPIKNYQYKIRSEAGTVIKDWQDAPDGNSVTVKGLNLNNNIRYYCDVHAVYSDGGVSEIGTSDGILVDSTPPEITSISLPKYAGSSGIDLSWAANDLESGVKCYAGIGLNPGETGITKGWIYLGNLRKFRLSQDINGQTINFVHQQKYYVSIMIQNGAGLAVQQTGSAVLVDLTPPDPPVVIDEGNYTNRNDQLKFSWKWPIGDPESGIREYWITLTTQRSITGSEKWYAGLQIKDILLRNLELIDGGTYYLAVKAINNAGAESIGFSDGILIDTKAPTLPVVNDSGDYSLSNNKLDVSMVASDAQSGVAGYTLSLGTVDNLKQVINNQQVSQLGGELVTLNSLALVEGQIYYFSITATDNAGNESMKSFSDGIMVDTKPPMVKSITLQGRYQTDSSRLIFDWTAESSPSGIIDAQYAISTDPNGTNLNWQSADLSGNQIVTGLSLEDSKTYYVFVRVQNRAYAENPPYNWSVPVRSNPISIDTTPPEILSIHAPALIGQHFLLQWEAQDTTSGITEYRYAVGSYRGGTDITDGWVSVVSNKTSFSQYRDDLPLQDNHSYYISVMAKNGAGLWSAVNKSEPMKTDLTAPVISKLAYHSAYINIEDFTNGINIDWAANDEQSGMEAIRIKIVTDREKQVLDSEDTLTNATSGTIHLVDLKVEDGRTYYIAFQAQNQMGAWSKVYYSNPILVDLTPPVVSILNSKPEFVTNTGETEFEYQLSEPVSLVTELDYPYGFEEISEPQKVEGSKVYHFNPRVNEQTGQKEDGTYTLYFYATDEAGNNSVSAIKQFIRINATPTVNLGSDITITKGTAVKLTAIANDGQPGGWIKEYQWNFGNNQIIITDKPECSYRFNKTGTFFVTIKVKDNDDKWSEFTTDPESDPAVLKVTVTNTFSGELQLDEDWDSTERIVISGDVKVPRGITLTIKPGTVIIFSGNYQILVNGKLIVEGTPQQVVTIGDLTTAWNGIRLENADSGSRIQDATIQNASVGLVLYQTEAEVKSCIFKSNRIGLHILTCNPLISGTSFIGNIVYGVKEDAGANPIVTGCIFSGNMAADYYEDKLGIIDPTTINHE